MSSLKETYITYVEAINDRDWALVASMVHPTVTRNGRDYTAEKYVTTMTQTTDPVPNLTFYIDMLLVDEDEQTVAARLIIVGRPMSEFLGSMATGERVNFAEHVFYRFENGLVREVNTVIDIETVRKQMIQPATVL